MTFEEYLAQFSGVESSHEIVIQDDDDMQAFNDMFHAKWADEHWGVIQEWQMNNHNDECEDCDRCLNT